MMIINKQQKKKMRIEGNIVDIKAREIYAGAIVVEQGRIGRIERLGAQRVGQRYIMLGFIDSHIHIESTLLTPTHFGELAIERGTVAVVADPHEIANVMGRKGVEFMLEDAERSAIRCFFTIPSSVPATPFDSSGGEISVEDVRAMAQSGRFVGLSEMMNVHGVVAGDESTHAKIEAARQTGIVIDGHAPQLRGADLERYIACGISTDHECTTIEEATEKVERGMKILIREGSAAKDYQSLKWLITKAPERVMFCTDDSHPDQIVGQGHIDNIVRRALSDGFDLYDVLRIASLNPIEHYRLDQGDLSVGSKADFIVVEDLQSFKVLEAYVGGALRYSAQSGVVASGSEVAVAQINNFDHEPITVEQLRTPVRGEISVIGVTPDSLLTSEERYTPEEPTENLECDARADIVKIVYINRYNNSAPVVAYARGFGLAGGAMASSVGHDSHNIVAVGSSDNQIVEVVNALIKTKGGLALTFDGALHSLPLPIAGIMSDGDGYQVAAQYQRLLDQLPQMGCALSAPFMTLSFLALLVIPELKIGEGGLFRYSSFGWI